MNEKQQVPMCWKCSESIWVKDEDPVMEKFGAQVFVSCKKEPKIFNGNQYDLCPLLPEWAKK